MTITEGGVRRIENKIKKIAILSDLKSALMSILDNREFTYRLDNEHP